MKSVRPVVCRQPPQQSVFDNFDDIDPTLARLFAMRGLTSTDELNYSLKCLEKVGSLENIDDAASLVLAQEGGGAAVIKALLEGANGYVPTWIILYCFFRSASTARTR